MTIIYLRLSANSFSIKSFTREMMKLLTSTPDLNLIKKLWSIMKIKLYEVGKHYKTNADQW